jgi:glyoxylase-like metal-dependent hydrolase (beta-lactamase superfamily II)
MANFVYVIGDDQTRDCVLVDPAWDVQGILDRIDSDQMKLKGVLVTHYHPDHIGGDLLGHDVRGLADLMTLRPVPIHVNAVESEGVCEVSGVSRGDLTEHRPGDKIGLGDLEIQMLHTPGHTPGSQCFLIGSSLVSGDTLFVNGCGRVDLPGGNPEQMHYSLTSVLGKLPDDTVLYPGHDYAPRPSSTIGDEKARNPYMRVRNLDDWMRLMGR